MYFIYGYENNLTGKIYIGYTIDLEERDQYHTHGYSIKDGSLIEKKILQYGRHNFDFWTIEIVDTHYQAQQSEIYWIAEMRKQLGRNMVYNLTNGGDGIGKGFKWPDESKKKFSLTLTGKKRGKYAHGHSEETKIKCGASNKGKTWKIENGKRIWKERI